MKRLIALCLIAAASLAALAADPPKKADDIPPCCRTPLATGKPTDKSLYLLDSKWTSDVGKNVPLSVLRGRPQVVAMFFTHCEYACPIIVNDLRKLQAALPAKLRDKVDFLLVSFDAKRDTSEALAAFRKKENLPVASWTLLRGAEDDVRELAALLGINYAPDARGQFAHSNLITVLNAEGEVAFQQPGLNAAPGAAVSAIGKLLAPGTP
jgi:protein SCO1/2